MVINVATRRRRPCIVKCSRKQATACLSKLVADQLHCWHKVWQPLLWTAGAAPASATVEFVHQLTSILDGVVRIHHIFSAYSPEKPFNILVRYCMRWCLSITLGWKSSSLESCCFLWRKLKQLFWEHFILLNGFFTLHTLLFLIT